MGNGSQSGGELRGYCDPSGCLPSKRISPEPLYLLFYPLPPPEVNPAALPASEQPPRLPCSLSEAAAALDGDAVMKEALGPELVKAIVAVREVSAAEQCGGAGWLGTRRVEGEGEGRVLWTLLCSSSGLDCSQTRSGQHVQACLALVLARFGLR